MVAIPSELFERYDRPGPRYTSYPPLPRWSDEVTSDAWGQLVQRLTGPTALYVHVPFCEERCTYCGCNMVVARRQSAGDRYLNAIARQVEALPALSLRWIHLGGGTPTWLDPDQLDRLFAILDDAGTRCPDAEVSVEIDPMVTDDGRLDALARGRVTRVSLGVQSLDPTVLAAVGRPQCADRIGEVVEGARARGIGEVNLDLMTGLPHQTASTLAATLHHALTWRPDRLSVFGYAHVPWLKPHQQAIDEAALPGRDERAALRLVAHDQLTDAGYAQVGFDHYARPDDPLAVAHRNGTLGRNFMGYTPYRDLPVVALGPSAISEVDGHFVQVESHLGRWWRAIEQGRTPVTRAYASSADDRLNGAIIASVLCRGEVVPAEIEGTFGRLPDTWAQSIAQLAPLASDGLVELHADRITVTERGHFFLRVVAMAFDPVLQTDRRARYSQTV